MAITIYCMYTIYTLYTTRDPAVCLAMFHIDNTTVMMDMVGFLEFKSLGHT